MRLCIGINLFLKGGKQQVYCIFIENFHVWVHKTVCACLYYNIKQF